MQNGVVSKPYFFCVCVCACSLIQRFSFLMFHTSYDFVLNPKMPVSLLVPHLHLLARLSPMCCCCCLGIHMGITTGGPGVGAPTSLGYSLSSRVSLTWVLCTHLTLWTPVLGSSTAGLVVDSLPWAWLWNSAYHHSLGLAVPRPLLWGASSPYGLRSHSFLGSFLELLKQSSGCLNYASPFGPPAHAFSSSVLYPRFRDAAFLTEDLWPSGSASGIPTTEMG